MFIFLGIYDVCGNISVRNGEERSCLPHLPISLIYEIAICVIEWINLHFRCEYNSNRGIQIGLIIWFNCCYFSPVTAALKPSNFHSQEVTGRTHFNPPVWLFLTAKWPQQGSGDNGTEWHTLVITWDLTCGHLSPEHSISYYHFMIYFQQWKLSTTMTAIQADLVPPPFIQRLPTA